MLLGKITCTPWAAQLSRLHRLPRLRKISIIIDNFNQNVTWIASPHPRHLQVGLQFGLNTKTEINTWLRCWKTDVTRANHFSWYFKKKTENCERYSTYLYFRRYQMKITFIWYNIPPYCFVEMSLVTLTSICSCLLMMIHVQ